MTAGVVADVVVKLLVLEVEGVGGLLGRRPAIRAGCVRWVRVHAA